MLTRLNTRRAAVGGRGEPKAERECFREQDSEVYRLRLSFITLSLPLVCPNA